MFYALVCLIIFVCFLLALVVLAQNPKGGGLSSQFGAGGAANLMGVKRTGDLLEKLTWGFAIGLVVLSLGSYVVIGNTSGGATRSINQIKAAETKLPAPVAPAPTAPAPVAPAGEPAATPVAPTTPAQ
ncbi:preprotein translocase subunit SecG [Hymenobacter sp. ASUV-10]|uniref:Protein-export membrane protein SecG n=1 Tax=Hymenobacter aranciens TaxID=3063996 RepID=A0ABT9BH37_9BACT|nr:preprotein translocase subunit SecG [Hymenobacter sp. ASUV-10]MDO7875966.1 preprotein translocase subunit SecG [Hymenobacter sp. ASUV-10]